MALVDVVLPVFNSKQTVGQSVASILQQTVTDIRVIIVDDGSTDGTGEVLEHLASGDERVLLLVTPANRGIVDALNLGLQHCTAEYIARHDADDIAFPERFEAQLEYLEAHPDCVAVANNVWHIDAEGQRIGATHFHGDAVGNPYAIPAGEPYLMHPFLMARASAMKALGGYRYVAHAEDTDLCFRLERLGRLHVLDARLGEYRIHTVSITSGSAQNVRVGAVYSQLAALSARRWAEGRPDLCFTQDLAQQVQHADSLEHMIDLVSPQLNEAEKPYLEAAAAAKMLQLRVYRNFRLSMRDLRTIARLLLKNWNMVPLRDRLILLKTPFWYYYKPRAHLRWFRKKCLALLRPVQSK